MALAVEVIRRLWDRGLYRNNVWAKKFVARWLDTWAELRTAGTMHGVDMQLKELNPNPVELVKPVYWEEEKGDTPLGGAMGLRHEFTEKDDA